MSNNVSELNTIYRELFHIEDEAIIPLLASVIINAKTSLPPVWMYLIGASSGGKSAALSAFGKVPFLTQVSDFTPNTLLSGAKSKETETSLLKKLGNNFVIVMKDFTTILSKSEETQEQLMAQLREVYDGHITKFTGLGDVIEWGNKSKPSRAVFVMAATEAIYKAQEKFSDMGSRGVNYVLNDQDRVSTTRMALKKTEGFDTTLSSIQDRFKDFILEKLKTMPERFPELSEELTNNIIEVSDFVTEARSIVLRDYRGVKSLALSAEYPMRVAKQLTAVAKVATWLSGGTLPEVLEKGIYKMAVDCIPKQTKLALKVLAKYYRCDSGGVGREINYHPKRAEEWIDNLNMFGIVKRVKIDKKEYWQMEDKPREIIRKYFGVEMSGQFLLGDDVEDWGYGGNY